MNGSRRWLALALVATVLLSGVAIGILVDRMWLQTADATEARERKHAKHGMDRMLEHFRERLDLTDEQATKIEAILDDAKTQAMQLHERVMPELMTIKTDSRDAIRDVLEPDQMADYDEISKEFDERMHKRMRHKGGRGHHGPPGPH